MSFIFEKNSRTYYFYLNKSLQMRKLFFWADPKTLEITNLQKISDYITFQVQSNPEIRQLVDNVLTTGNVSIEFCKHDELRALACWVEQSRLIRITTPMPRRDSLIQFIFEMCNADNNALGQVNFTTSKNEIDYAEKKEAAEYHSFIKAQNLIASVSQGNKVVAPLDNRT